MPARSSAYLAWLRTQRCIVNNDSCARAIESAHTGPHALAQRASDFDAIPLCGSVHHREGPLSYHVLGEGLFCAVHHIDLPRRRDRLRKQFDDQQRRRDVSSTR